MSDAEKAYQATPASTLEEQIMNPCIAKNEREWWAAAEIERLRSDLEAADIAISRLNGSSELQMLMRENNKLRACLVDIATGQVIELPFIQALARAALAQEKQ